jgi:hypothetical protein
MLHNPFPSAMVYVSTKHIAKFRFVSTQTEAKFIN